MGDPQVQVVVNHWILEGQVVWRRHPIKRHVSPDCRVIGGQEAAREDLDPIQFESFKAIYGAPLDQKVRTPPHWIPHHFIAP